MKSILMSARFGLISARSNALLPCDGRATLTAGAAAQLQQEQSARIQIPVGREAAHAAFAAMGSPAVPAPDAGGYAPTKHARNGGLRGPYSWRQPPVIT